MGDTYSLHQCQWNDGYQNKSFFLGEGTDVGRGESNFTCQQIIHGLSVQCNVVEPYSIVQFSPALGWFTEKYRKCMQNTTEWLLEKGGWLMTTYKIGKVQ